MNRSSSSKIFLVGIDVSAAVVSWNPKILLRPFNSSFCVGKVCLTFYFNLLTSERERTMLFPDYYFLAERRLVNHTIETREVKNLDDCELLCYLNDNCVSLNFKIDLRNNSENNKSGHICELNNATHLKYDSDLTTNVLFHYRGSKVSFN